MIEDFLSEQSFLPVVISGGICPEYLQRDHYVFRLRRNELDCVSSNKFKTEMDGFREYVKGNIEEVCKVLEEMKTSIVITEYKGLEEQKKIYTFFIAVGFVYYAYLRKSHTERIALDFFLPMRKPYSKQFYV